LQSRKKTMAKILGVQHGTPHLGNLLGAIIPAIQLSNDPKRIIPFHCRFTFHYPNKEQSTTADKHLYAAAAWLACG
jgi:tryptophanyl-tRNA synthetase